MDELIAAVQEIEDPELIIELLYLLADDLHEDLKTFRDFIKEIKNENERSTGYVGELRPLRAA